MTEFRIKVIKQKRILISILINAIILPFLIRLSTQLDLLLYKITVPILIYGIVILFSYYFSFGLIKTEQGYLTKIITEENVIEIGGIKSRTEGNLKLLKLILSKIDLQPIDSWDVLKQKGYLKIGYLINLLILFLLTVIIITQIILNGFDSKLLLFIPLILGQLIFSHFQLKSKL